MKKVLSFILVLSMVLGSFGMAFADTTVVVPTAKDLEDAKVTDIKDSAYAEAFAKLYAVGVVQGREDGGADLEANITRAEAAKVILHMLGLQEGIANFGPDNSGFTDVSGHWASQYISVAAGQGIVNGYPDGTFKPDAAITEEQIVAMIVRALEWGPIVGGNYPYGEYGKALELKIIDKAPVTGKVATRGYSFEVAANSLTAQMAERKATTGGISYEGEGYRTLLTDRLGVNRLEEAVVYKTARMDREFAATEFEAAKEGKNGKIYVYNNASFDATTVLGDFVNVWYKVNSRTKDNEVVYLERDNSYSKVVGIVKESTKDSIELENGRTYKLNEMNIFVDNNETKDYTKAEGALVTITLDKKNNAVFVDGFDITVDNNTNTLDLVAEINKVEDNRFEFYNQNGIKRILEDEKLIVYKDGKIVSTKDITEYDLVKAIDMKGQAKTTFVLVVGEKAVGEFNKVTLNASKSNDPKVVLEVAGEEYVAYNDNFVVVADDLKSSEVYDDYKEVAEDLRDFLKEEVTLISIAGKVKLLVAKGEPKVVNSGLVINAGLKYQTFKAKDEAALNLLDGSDKEIEISFEKQAAASTNLFAFEEIRNDHLATTGNQASGLEGYTNIKHDGNRVSLFYNTTGKAFVEKSELKAQHTAINLGTTGNEKFDKLTKGTLVAGTKTYDIKDSTVFYVLNKAQDEYTAYKYADIKDAKAYDNVYVNVTIDADTKNYNTPTADVVVVTQGYFEVDTDLEYGIVTWSRAYSDSLRYSIYNGEKEIEYIADKKDGDLVKAGNAVTFKLTGKKVDELEQIKDVKEATAGTLTNIKSGNLYTIDGKVYEIAKDGLIVLNEGLYDSKKSIAVSYALENGKLKVLNYLNEAGKGTLSGLRVRSVSANRITVEEGNSRNSYDVYGTEAQALMPLITTGAEVSFIVDNFGDIVEFTFIKLGADVTNNVTVSTDDLVIDGNGYNFNATLTVESDDVVVRNLNGTGTIVVAAGVNNFTAEDTVAATITLNGGGMNSVHLDNVTVTTLNIDAAVRVVLKGETKATTVALKTGVTGAKLAVEGKATVTNALPAGLDATYTATVKEVTVTDAVYNAANGETTFKVVAKDQFGEKVEVKRADVKVNVVTLGATTAASVRNVITENDVTTVTITGAKAGDTIVATVKDKAVEQGSVVQ